MALKGLYDLAQPWSSLLQSPYHTTASVVVSVYLRARYVTVEKRGKKNQIVVD